MKLFLIMIMMVGVAHAEVTHDDIETALHTVTAKTLYPDQYRITKIRMDGPLGVIWNHKQATCEVLMSARDVNSISLLIGIQPKMPMLEGFIAHELSHCVELKGLSKIGGYPEMQKLLQNPDARVASELMSDIVAIMYWKRFYPNGAVNYIGALIGMRRGAHGDHATYPSLELALPLIPARVDYRRAAAIRDIVLPR